MIPASAAILATADNVIMMYETVDPSILVMGLIYPSTRLTTKKLALSSIFTWGLLSCQRYNLTNIIGLAVFILAWEV